MNQRSRQFILLFGDICILALSLLLTIFLRKLHYPTFESFESNLILFIPHYIIWGIVYYISGLNSFRSLERSKLFASLFMANFINGLASTTLFYVLTSQKTPKLILLIHILLFFILSGLWRYIFSSIFARYFQKNAILIGDQETIEPLKKYMDTHPLQGYRHLRSFSEIPTSQDIKSSLLLLGETGLIAISRKLVSQQTNFASYLRKNKINLIELSAFNEAITKKIQIDSLEEGWFLEHCWIEKNNGVNKILKRSMDFFFCLLALVILSIPFCILMIILLLTSGRPIFYTQKRAGKNGKVFTLIKLRTMSTNAEKDGAKWAVENDQRITPIGRFLRKTRIDELPQIVNIIKGDMSIVGPRPERPEFLDELSKEIPFFRERQLALPGLTGWSQVNSRYAASKDDAKEKLKYDLFYIKNQSPLFDLFIILKTVRIVLIGTGQ